MVSDPVQWIRDSHGVHWQLILPETTWEILSSGGSAPQASLSVISELCLKKNDWKPIGFIRLESRTGWPKAAPAPVQTMTCISEQKTLGENREGRMKNAKLVHIWKWVNSDYYLYIWSTSSHFLCVYPTQVYQFNDYDGRKEASYREAVKWNVIVVAQIIKKWEFFSCISLVCCYYCHVYRICLWMWIHYSQSFFNDHHDFNKKVD